MLSVELESSGFPAGDGWAPRLVLFVGVCTLVPGCGADSATTTPAPTLPVPPPPAPDPPPTPTGLRVSSNGDTWIEWSWTAVEGASGYEIQFSTDEVFADEDEIVSRAATELTYRREGLSPETGSWLRVRAVAASGDDRLTSVWSASVSGMTAKKPLLPVPTGLRVSASGCDFIEWSWTAVEGAAGYEAWFSADEAFDEADEVVAIPVDRTFYRRESLGAGTQGFLRVRSVVAAEEDRLKSEWSMSATGMTQVRTIRAVVPFGPAEAGKLASDAIEAWVGCEGAPAAGAAYRWEADENAGWVYPPEGVTDADGRVSGRWVPGSPGAGVLTLTVSWGASSLTGELETRSVVPARPPARALNLWANHRGRGTGYRMDPTPLTEPGGTYYAAIRWDGGYTGLQRAGTRYDRLLQFSVWDAPGGGDARVVETAADVVCTPFGGEGTGQKCELNYPWNVGATYRFEVTEEDLDGGSAITLHVTDLGTDERRFVGTLRYAARADLTFLNMFVEGF